MATSTGSIIFALIALLAIGIAVLLLLRHFLPLRSTPAFLTIPVFLALFLPITAVLLLPIDLASTTRTKDDPSKGIWLAQRAILVAWRIIYWLTFLLTWVLLPLLGEYMDAGHRDPKARMIYALKSNGRYQAIVLACAIAGFVYITISYQFDFTAIKALVMALAYVWGLILAIYLMGHGLVAVPRKLIRNANISGRLQRVHERAPYIHEKLDDSVLELEELEAQVMQLKQRKTGTALDFQEWIDDLADMTGQPESRILSNPATINASAKVPAVITERYLADLTRRLGRAKHQRARYIEDWDRIVQTASDLQVILDSKTSKSLSFGRDSSGQRFSPMTPYTRYLLHIHVLPAARLILGSCLAVASVAIIWSEIIKFPAPQLSAVSLTVIHRPSDEDYQVGLGGQFLAAAWITYMCLCALNSVNDVPVWNGRALVRRNTYAESACWYAGQIAKLTVPLAYNFLTFLPKSIHKNTTFYDFLGKLINLTPLGTWFDYLFPMFILLPVCATFFNLYGRMKRLLGFGILNDEDEVENPSGFGTGGWREGRDLIARDLNGPGPSTFGLTDSPRPSMDNPRTQVPSRTSIPPPDRPTASRSVARPSRPELDPEPQEENFFTLFGRRVKNTIDTIDTPKWMKQPNTAGGLKRPKWLDRNGDDGSGQGRSTQNRDVLGLFGGRSTNE